MKSRRLLPTLFRAGAVVALLLAGLLLLEKWWLRRPPGPFALAAVVVLTAAAVLCWRSASAIARNPKHRCRLYWLAGATFLCSYTALDLLCGALRPSPSGPLMVADQRRHHRLVPNQTTLMVEEDFRCTVRTNSRGLRGPEVTTPKPAGTRRLLLLGDSFTMGKGVDDEHTFARRLEATLRQRPDGAGFEVVNGGIDSYTPLLSRLLLDELLDLEPEHVIHGLDMSDLLQEQAYRSLATRGEDGSITAVPGGEAELGWSRWAADWFMQHTVMTGFLIHELRNKSLVTVRNFVRMANPEMLLYTIEGDAVDRTRMWDDLFESISAIAGTCRARGIRYTLVIYPWGHQVNPREWRRGREYYMPPGAIASDAVREVIARRAAGAGVQLIDTFDAFRAHTGPELLYFENDMHWTPAGHARMAEALAARLEL